MKIAPEPSQEDSNSTECKTKITETYESHNDKSKSTELSFNPFISRTPTPSVYEWCKLSLGVVIVPVKAVLLLFFFILAWIMTVFSAIGLSKYDLSNGCEPVSAWRRRCLWPLRIVARCMLFVMGFYWIRVIDKRSKVDRAQPAPVIVVNHVTFVDAMFVLWKHAPMFVGKKEVLDLPLLGLLIKCLQPILVDRASATSKSDTLNEIQRRVLDPSFPPVCIFPEGTTSNNQSLLMFKKGAFVAGKPVQPVFLRYRHRFSDPSWVSVGPALPMLIVRVMCQFINHLEVTYLPIYHPNAEEIADSMHYARAVQSSMCAHAGILRSDFAFEDMLLMTHALKRSLPPTAGTLPFTTLQRSFSVFNVRRATELLAQFAKADTDHNGKLSKEEFATSLKLPMCDFVDSLFDLLDTDESGDLDFREYVTGAMLSSKCSLETILQTLWRFMSESEQGEQREQSTTGVNISVFTQTLQIAIAGASEPSLHQLFKDVDADGDGLVTVDELMAWCGTHPHGGSVVESIVKLVAEHKQQGSADGAATTT